MVRLAQSYGAMWSALSAKPRDILSRKKKGILLGSAFLATLMGFIPVPVTSLASAEIVAEAPFIVAAPIDGVIEEIVIAPNSPVKAGDVLARQHISRFNGTVRRNDDLFNYTVNGRRNNEGRLGNNFC